VVELLREAVPATALVVAVDPGKVSKRAWLARARSTAVDWCSVDHRSRLPAGHQHQFVFIAALGQPASGEGMPELVRVHRRDPAARARSCTTW
jgi:hypothetical protein